MPPRRGTTSRRQAVGMTKVSSSGRSTSAASEPGSEPGSASDPTATEPGAASAPTATYPLRSFSAITFARYAPAASADSNSFACVRPCEPTRP